MEFQTFNAWRDMKREREKEREKEPRTNNTNPEEPKEPKLRGNLVACAAAAAAAGYEFGRKTSLHSNSADFDLYSTFVNMSSPPNMSIALAKRCSC